MRRKILIASLVATAVWFVCAAVFIPLACTGKVVSGFDKYFALFVVLLMIWVPYILNLINIKFDFTTLIAYLVFIFLATMVGTVWNVYKILLWYDTLIHLFSGVLIGFIGYSLFTENSKAKLEYFWLFVFIVAFTMLCGGIWEIYEFTGDSLLGTNMQVYEGFVGQDALVDTMIDLICDFGGSLIAAICCMFIEKDKRAKEKIFEGSDNTTTVEQPKQETEKPLKIKNKK